MVEKSICYLHIFNNSNSISTRKAFVPNTLSMIIVQICTFSVINTFLDV